MRTPRSGTAVTHRLLVLADAAATPWLADRRRPGPRAGRARSGGLGGERARTGESRPPARADAATTITASDLSVLKLSALDALAMATDLDEALLDHFGADALVLDRDTTWPAGSLTLDEFLELARATRELLDGARPLDARDLALPGPSVDPGVDAADLAARAKIATGALAGARTWPRCAGGQTAAPGARWPARRGSA